MITLLIFIIIGVFIWLCCYEPHRDRDLVSSYACAFISGVYQIPDVSNPSLFYQPLYSGFVYLYDSPLPESANAYGHLMTRLTAPTFRFAVNCLV